MKSLLAVILIALCAIVFNSNKSQAQEDTPLPSWTVEVHGEGGVGLISGASVEILNNSNTVVFTAQTTISNGQTAWVVPQGFPSGTYKIHLQAFGSHGEVYKTVSYSNGIFFDTINLGPVL